MVALAVVAQPSGAQSPAVSRPVVQALPSRDSQRLNAALARIARDPRDASALIEAGDAASAMGDPEAAIGFYRRADQITTADPRVKAGLARALVLRGDPVAAIPLFAQAEAGGAVADIAADRGLAYDLVGDTARAQQYYRTALARHDDDETRRRLGISLAIAGDAPGSEAMLMPLLRKQDKPGWRAHAFALAIAGKTKEAVDTVNAILPPVLAQSISPYLRYMPRLTRAQQAAAANLGKFPRASEIGHDDPAIAALAPTSPHLASADAGLIPQGKLLGGGRARASRADLAQAEPVSRSRARAQAAQRLARREADKADRVAPPDPAPAIGRETGGELPPVSAAGSTSAVAAAPTSTPVVQTVPSATLPASSPAPAPRAQVARVQLPETRPAAAPLPRETQPAPTPQQTVAPAQQGTSVVPTPGFDLARLGASSPAVSGSAPSQPASAAPTNGPARDAEVPPPPATLEQIFADLGAPSSAAAPVAGAVDIRAIVPAKPAPKLTLAGPTASQSSGTRPVEDADVAPDKKSPAGRKAAASTKAGDEKVTPDKKAADAKETARKPGAKKGDAEDAESAKGDPKKADAKKDDAKKGAKKAVPSHPSRIWVQIGVGRETSAIAFDWRKFVKQAPAVFKGRTPYISDMGRTNRILAGPFETQKAAADFLAQLKKADFTGAFIWMSPAGQVVDPLPAK